MGDRINDVEQWFRNLDRTLREVQEAVDRLSEAKVETERTIAENLPLLEAAKECLNLRDRRREIDLVEDDVYHEVKKVRERNMQGIGDIYFSSYISRYISIVGYFS